jgi:hypothetical protein
MISFPSDSMAHIPEAEMPDVAKAARAVIKEAIDAGVYFFSGGAANEKAIIVATDGTITDGANPAAIGGVTMIEVPSRREALEWAAKIAVACRCAQEVWEFGRDPEIAEMLRQSDNDGFSPDH